MTTDTSTDSAVLAASHKNEWFVAYHIAGITASTAKTAIKSSTVLAVQSLMDRQSARIAELEASLAQQVPVLHGWRLVPVELTKEMLDAAGLDCTTGSLRGAWADMLHAAPLPPSAA